jgi:hypothetical protein
MGEHLCTVTSKLTGATFGVRVVFPGERYGLEDRCVNKGRVGLDTLVEFYDLKNTEKFGPRGQFVTRYQLRTILVPTGRTAALDLHMGEPRWKLCEESRYAAVQAAARAATEWWNAKYPPRT